MTAIPTSTRSPGSALAETWNLEHVGGRPKLRLYLAELWQRRHFALELARSRFRAENEADRLGAAWIILRPLLQAAVYGIVFGLVLVSASRPDDYIPYLVTGVFLFQFFGGSFSVGAQAIVANMGLVTTLHFPRAVLPIAVVYQQFLEQLWMCATLAVIVRANGDPIRLSWLLVLPALVLYGMFNLGVAFISARLTIHMRDVTQLIPFVTRLLFYLSGVFVSMQSVLKGHPKLLEISDANPLYVFVTLIRVAFLGAHNVFAVPHQPHKHYAYDMQMTWIYALVWGIGLMILGFLFFWRAEDEYGRE